MLDIELFVHFAEVAGVFVGFGALIGLRSAHVSDAHDVTYMRGVLGVGVWVVISALVPIPVSRYEVEDHTLWLSCALLALALWAAFTVSLNIKAESRAINRSPEPIDRFFPVVGLPLHIITVGSLLLILVGVWPGADEALYVTALSRRWPLLRVPHLSLIDGAELAGTLPMWQWIGKDPAIAFSY